MDENSSHTQDMIRNTVARGVLTMSDDGQLMQTAQLALLDGEVLDGAERFQQYGFTAHPLSGAEVCAVFVGADRSHPIIVAVDDRRFRVQSLKPGEVCIYTDEGDTITLKRNNEIAFKTKKLTIDAVDSVAISTKSYTVTASEGVHFVTPAFSLGGDGGGAEATFTGNLNTTGDMVAGSISQQHHTHTGVESGPADTGQPKA